MKMSTIYQKNPQKTAYGKVLNGKAFVIAIKSQYN